MDCRLSVLVVSRTPSLLNRLLASFPSACSLPLADVEILCSWNGSIVDEAFIHVPDGLLFRVVSRAPYHFAANVNSLVRLAQAESLLLVNDDVILDRGSVDSALAAMASQAQVALIGSHLRGLDGRLTHAGILFDCFASPFHYLESLVSADHTFVLRDEARVVAASGALMLIRRLALVQLRMNEAYRVCGEDVEFCLDVCEILGSKILYLPEFSGVHEAESTRSSMPGQGANSSDQVLLKARRKRFERRAGCKVLIDEWRLQRDVACVCVREGHKSLPGVALMAVTLLRSGLWISWRVVSSVLSRFARC